MSRYLLIAVRVRGLASRHGRARRRLVLVADEVERSSRPGEGDVPQRFPQRRRSTGTGGPAGRRVLRHVAFVLAVRRQPQALQPRRDIRHVVQGGLRRHSVPARDVVLAEVLPRLI